MCKLEIEKSIKLIKLHNPCFKKPTEYFINLLERRNLKIQISLWLLWQVLHVHVSLGILDSSIFFYPLVLGGVPRLDLPILCSNFQFLPNRP